MSSLPKIRSAGRGSAVQFAALFFSTAIAILGLLSVVVAGRIREAEQGRARAQTQVFATSEADARLFLTSNLVDMDGHPTTINSLTVATGVERPPIPPGIPRLPAPGEVFVSPKLLAECTDVDRCPLAGKIVGSIAPDGLINLDQRLAYVGVDRSMLLLGGDLIVSFGAQGRTRTTRFRVGDAGFALFVVLPLAGLIAVAARWGARRNARRNTTLRMLGATPFQATLDQTIRAMVASALGAGLGVVLYSVASRSAHRIWFVNRAVDNRDLQLPWSTYSAVVTLVVVFVVGVAAAAAVATSRNPLARMSAARHGRSRGPTILLTIGAGVIVVRSVAAVGSPRGLQMTPLLELGLVMFGIGLSSGLAPAVRVLGRWVARHFGPGALVSGEQIQDDPLSATRASAPIAVACFVSCLAVTISTIYAPLVVNESLHPERDATILFATRDTDHISIDKTALPTVVREVVDEVKLVGVDGTEIGRGIVSDCAQLRTIFGSTISGCSGQPQLLRLGGATPDSSTRIFLSDGSVATPIPLTVSKSSISGAVQSALPIYDLTVIVPPNWQPAAVERAVHTRLIGRVTADRHDLMTLKSAVLRADPTADVELPSPGGDSLSGIFRWLFLGVLLAASLSFVAMVIAFIDIADQRRRSRALLDVVGSGRRLIAQTHLAYVILPAIVNIAFAVVIGAIASLAYAGSTRYLPSAPTFLEIALVGIGSCVAAGLLSIPRRQSPSALAQSIRAE